LESAQSLRRLSLGPHDPRDAAARAACARVKAWGLLATAIGLVFLAFVGAALLVIAASDRIFAETFYEDF
jgi:hypothetical protein